MTQTSQATRSAPGKGSTRLGRARAALDRVLRHPVADGVVMALILLSVVLLVIEIEELVTGQALEWVILAGHVITGVFIVELSLRWFAAPSTRRFWREYWLDVLAVLPFLRPLRLMRVLRLLGLYRVGVMAQRFVRPQTDYQRQLNAETRHYRGDYAAQVWMAPDLYRLRGALLDDGRVHASARRDVLAALAYVVAPYQVLSREDHGPEGYLDQVYVALEVVQRLMAHELPEWLIEDAWDGEGEIAEIVDADLPMLRDYLGEEAVEALHRYLGLQTPEADAAAPA